MSSSSGKPKKGVFITGATSGIGLALAEEYAKLGNCKLALTGRRKNLLDDIKKNLTEKHPDVEVEVAQLDVTDVAAVRKVFGEMVEMFGQIHVAYANAGITPKGRVGTGQEYFETHVQCVQTNLIGSMVVIDVALEHFKSKGQGQIVAVSSVLAFRGAPKAAAYSASKAGLDAYMEAARLENREKDITFTTFHPGFIETDMVKVLKKKPYSISTTECAQIMIKKVQKRTISSPIPFWPWILMRWFVAFLPDRHMKFFG